MTYQNRLQIHRFVTFLFSMEIVLLLLVCEMATWRQYNTNIDIQYLDMVTTPQ